VDGAFVTGGSGFVGGRLVERLVADGVRARRELGYAPMISRDEGLAALQRA
jgi:nucleoside-diphosphate-sugar epimerase